jgi:hypothetical protein
MLGAVSILMVAATGPNLILTIVLDLLDNLPDAASVMLGKEQQLNRGVCLDPLVGSFKAHRHHSGAPKNRSDEAKSDPHSL